MKLASDTNIKIKVSLQIQINKVYTFCEAYVIYKNTDIDYKQNEAKKNLRLGLKNKLHNHCFHKISLNLCLSSNAMETFFNLENPLYHLFLS